MTSDSKRYAQLATIYHEKALSDAAEVLEFTKQVENERGAGDVINKEMCYRFCKYASQIRLQRGTVKDSDEAFKELLENIPVSSMNEDVVSPSVWFILLRAADKFCREKGRYPGTNGVPCSIDAFDLRQRVISLLSANQALDIERLMTSISENAIKEMCRYGAGEPNVVASFIGGITAQEVIKLATNQYVPLNNTFIFDGHTQTSAVYQL